MKIRMKKRLTAILLCMAMIVSALGSNGVVLAADKSDNTEIPGTAAEAEMLNETSQAEAAAPVESETADAQTEPVVMTEVQTEDAALPETETNTEPAAENIPETEAVSEVQSESQEEIQTEMTSETSETALTETESNSEEMQSQYLFENDEMTVEVSLKNVDTVPADAALVVKPILNKTISDNSPETDKAEKAAFDKIDTLLNEKAEKDAAPIDGFNAYEIYFEKDGVIYQVIDEMKVSINFKNFVLPEIFKTEGMNIKATQAQVLQFTADENEAGKTNVTDLKDKTTVLNCDTDLAVGAVAFESDHVSQFAIAWNGADTTTEYTYDDDQVTVKAVLSEAGILPRGVELKVVPVVEKEELDRVESLLNANVKAEDDTITGFLAYDISFVKDGVEVEPSGEVKVSLNFKETVLPEQVQENKNDRLKNIELYHLVEINQNDVQVKKVENADFETTKDAAVKNVDFTVESFSTFVLQWGEDGENKNAELLTKEESNAVSLDNEIINDNSRLIIRANQARGNGYQVRFHIYVGEEGQELSKYVKANGDHYSYSFSNKSLSFEAEGLNNYIIKKVELNKDINLNNSSFINYVQGNIIDLKDYKGIKIYLQKPQPKQIDTVSTLDTASIIDLKLFDYISDNNLINNGHKFNFIGDSGSNVSGADINSWTGSQNGAYQGIVKNKLNNGYPVLSDSLGGESLSYLFNEQNVVGKNIMGTNLNHLFVNRNGYYSFDSSQNYAVQNGSDFILYDAIATPNADIFRYGNFFPYNSLSGYNKYIGKLDGKDFYQFSSRQDGQNANNKANYHFGMTMEADFSQPKNGKISNDSMVFNFSGDDDVWVFIDDVLVLDIGGIHDKTSGSIDFATGKVTVGKVTKRIQGGYGTETTLLKIFNNAGKDTSSFSGNTFGDYTKHTMKFFYLERGAGASNCKIEFNIPVVPKDSLMIRKEITNTNKDAYSDVEFSFNLFLKGSEDAELTKVVNREYKIYEGGVDTGKTGNIDSDGIFKLKHNEAAVFEGIPVDTLYQVKEIDVHSNEYDKVIINSTEIKVGDMTVIEMSPVLVGDVSSVTFQNNCSAENKRELKVKKELVQGQNSNLDFAFLITVGGRPYEGVYYKNGNGTAVQEPMVDGKITLKQNEYITICDLPSGTSFEVKETGSAYDYKVPVYKIDHADNINLQDSASGTMQLKENTTVTVINEMVRGTLAINKEIDKANWENGDPIFTFKIDYYGESGNEIKETFYCTLRFEDGTYNKSLTLDNLKLGKYVVTELETIRYQCQSVNPQEIMLTTSNQSAVANYANKRVNGDNYSHTDVVVNSFTMDEQGNIIITQQLKDDKTY